MPRTTLLTVPVRSTEIDVNGHVNNAKYLEYLEWGREDWYDTAGLDYNTLIQAGAMTVVVHVSANYRKEAVQNDQLSIKTWVQRFGNTSFTMMQEIHNQHQHLVLDAEFVLVTVHPQTRVKTQVPQVIRDHA